MYVGDTGKRFTAHAAALRRCWTFRSTADLRPWVAGILVLLRSVPTAVESIPQMRARWRAHLLARRTLVRAATDWLIVWWLPV